MSPDGRPNARQGSTTYGGRTGRMGPMRQQALAELVPALAVDLGAVASRGEQRLVVEIGCGKGDATVAMAAAGDRDSMVLACDVNVAVVAALAMAIDAQRVTNVRLWVGDAFALLDALGPATIDEVRVWFPDPWPKPRHAPKRLVTPERVATITNGLRAGGVLRLATDDAAYAAQAVAVLAAERRLEVAVVARPDDRPVTAFEARGRREGRSITDVLARRRG